MKLTIEKVRGGYILEWGDSWKEKYEKQVTTDIEQVLDLVYKGMADEMFIGDQVIVRRIKDE